MLYKIEVYDDGDIFVTKIPSKQFFETNLCLDNLDNLRAELESYGVEELENDMNEINSGKLYEAVRCL